MVIVEQTGAGETSRIRLAGRVIVLDPDDRVLLFRYDDGPPNGQHWCTPGGGLNDGEDYPAGARRELAEETGWTDVALGEEIFERALTMGDADGIAAWRWWTLAELDSTTEAIWPTGLADLIRGARG